MRSKLFLPAAAVAAVASVAALLLNTSGVSPAATTTSCTSYAVACSGGTCTGTVPDGGEGLGLLTANVAGYTVRLCATVNRTLSGAGTLKDYHCSGTTLDAGAFGCPEVLGNAQAVTASAVRCQEFPPFVVPYTDNTGDKMVWIPNAVTVSGGAVVDVSICPNY
jgi:hypothetical protein